VAHPSGLNLRVPQPFTFFVKGADFEFGPVIVSPHKFLVRSAQAQGQQ
jgi:hypothetical protein